MPRDQHLRRVYMLPSGTVDRIVAFQKHTGFPSEVDAVRHLLALALDIAEDPDQLCARLEAMPPQKAVEEAVKSPLTLRLDFRSNDTLVTLTCGRELPINFRKGA